MKNRLAPSTIAVLAVLIALTAVFTLIVRVPVGATGGYFNLSGVAVALAGLGFGASFGGLAGGIGAAIADALGGYAFFAPLSLVAHGLEGLLMGVIAGRQRSLLRMVLGWLAGSAAMVATYFLGEWLIYPVGLAAALAELPFNVLQALVGGAVGIPLLLAVRRAYPQIDNIGRPRSWTEADRS